MFMTKEEAITEMQELATYIEMMLEYGDEEVLEYCAGDLETLHNKLYESVLQLKNISDRYLNVEMRNYTALTVREARQAIREAEAIA